MRKTCLFTRLAASYAFTTLTRRVPCWPWAQLMAGALLCHNVPANAQQVDTQAPTFGNFSASPAALNVATAAGQISVTVPFTDDYSGLIGGTGSLTAPNGTTFTLYPLNIAGSPLSGTLTFISPIPAYAPAGIYTVTKLCSEDLQNNKRCYTGAALTAMATLGSASVTVTSAPPPPPDTLAPVITTLNFGPATQTLGTVAGMLSATVAFTDNQSGLQIVTGQVTAPSGPALQLVGATYPGAPGFTGSQQNGTLIATGSVPLASAGGIYTLTQLCASDAAQNSRCYSGSALTALAPAGSLAVNVVGGTGADTVAPVITGFTFGPATQNLATASGSLNVTAAFTDNQSGLDVVIANITDPNGLQITAAGGAFAGAPGFTGTRLNGSLLASQALPPLSTPGTYTLTQLCAMDAAKNQRCYSASGLATLATAGSGVTVNVGGASTSTLTVAKTASQNPMITGKAGQFYTVQIAVSKSATTAPIVLADTFQTGIVTSGPVTATGGTLSGCPSVGSPGLTGCTIATGAAVGTVVITAPVQVGPAASSATNTVTVRGGGDTSCTGMAPACTASTPPIGILRTENESVGKLFNTPSTSNVAANDVAPAGSVFSITPGSTCPAAAVSAQGLASYTSPAALGSCKVTYQVCAPAPNQAVCSPGTLTVAGSIPRDAGSGANASPIEGPRGGMTAGPVLGLGLGSLAVVPKDCDSISINAIAFINSGNADPNKYASGTNTCNFSISGLTAGNWNVKGSVTPKTIPVSPAVIIAPYVTFVVPASGVLAGKAVYDLMAAKWKLVQTP